MKIGVAILARDMAPFIGAAVRSVSWADAIYLYDDGSTDGTADIAQQAATNPIRITRSPDTRTAFERGEAIVRNEIMDAAFSELSPDLLISLDADELLGQDLRSLLELEWKRSRFDSVCMPTWHLYDERRYLHVYEQKVGRTALPDPHVRIATGGLRFVDSCPDGKHPYIPMSPFTLVLNGPYHFHLKYYYLSTYPNHSLGFLPSRFDEASAGPYLRNLPFELPSDIQAALESVAWDV